MLFYFMIVGFGVLNIVDDSWIWSTKHCCFISWLSLVLHINNIASNY